jgi:DnaJ family protein C protein 1
MHYLVQSLNYRRDTGRVSELVDAAKVAAWGPKLVPFDGRRKVKVPLGPPRTDTDGNAFARTIDVVVEGNGDVFLVRAGSFRSGHTLINAQVEGSELIPLDNSATTPPSINRTWFVALCTSLFHRVTGKAPSASTEEADAAEESHEPTAAKASGRRKVTKRR